MKRATGLTESERYLRQLCERTFLSMWSNVNVYRAAGKELCDLLVVCGNDVIIFSDKHCEFPNTGDARLDWNRWFKRAIYKSAKQAWRAERWLRQYPERVFLDSQCKVLFPYNLPPPERARYHIIVVAHGCADRCAKMTGWSSLPVDSWVHGNVHYIPKDVPPRFVIGDVDPHKSFVHVLTDGSLERILRTRDTVTDFVSYIRKKELLFRGPFRVIAAGEDDLLPLYLRNMNAQGEHDFAFPTVACGIRIKSGHWDFFQNHEVRRLQVEANKISYLWDLLIERFAKHAIEGTQYAATVPGIKNAEVALRFMALEDRTSRRLLSKAFLEIVDKGRFVPRATRYLVEGSDHAKYVFMTLKKFSGFSEEEYRIARQRMLEVCCTVVKLKCPDATDIVGIATEPGIDREHRSEDSVYLDARNWSPEDLARVRQVAKELDVGNQVTRIEKNENEYPSESTSVDAFLAGR